MSTANDGVRPGWAGPTGGWRPRAAASPPPSSEPGDPATGSEPSGPELADLRRSMEERFRALNHRLDALDTDILRLVTLIRNSTERHGPR